MFLSVSLSRKVLGVFPSVCFSRKIFGVFLSLNASVCLSACLPASQGRCRRCYRLFSFATIKILDVFPSQNLFASQVKCLVCFRLPVCQVIYLVCFRLPVCQVIYLVCFRLPLCQVIYLVCFRLYVSQRRLLECFRSCVYLSRDSPPFKKIFREFPPPPPHTLRCSLQCGQVMWNTSCGTQEQFAESIASSYSVEHVTSFIILKVMSLLVVAQQENVTLTKSKH